MNEIQGPRLFLVGSGSGSELEIVEANDDKEAVKKYLKANGLQMFDTFIVRYVSDPVATYRVSIEEAMQPHPDFKGDAIA